MTDFIQVSTTTEHKQDAEKIAMELVNRKLAACVQVLGPISSTFSWKEKIEVSSEWLCVAKTRRDAFKQVEKMILELHDYDVPEIIATEIVDGSAGYLDWLEAQTGEGDF